MLSKWLDNCIQEVKNSTALVVQGPQASGKTLFADMLAYKMKQKHVAWPRINELDRNFNSYFLDKKLVIFDEVDRLFPTLYLKKLISEKSIEISAKSKENTIINNNLNIIFLTKEENKASDRLFLYTTPIQAIATLHHLTA